MNILNNAQQAIDGYGDIFVTTSQEGEMVTVNIRDTGARDSRRRQEQDLRSLLYDQGAGRRHGVGAFAEL